ncbi:MAG: lipoyl synthase [Christensenellales bacterium]|jgi:lipoic acid synthetase
MDAVKPMRKPEWLRVKANTGKANDEVMAMLQSLNLHTVCEEAACPNCGECFGRRTATFMILGNVCTRNCRYCNVTGGEPTLVDPEEPAHIAEAVEKLGLRHAVITSVTRDDLEDGGAGHFANVITAIKTRLKDRTPVIEVLIPDFKGEFSALMTVINAGPDIINHNVETVPRLYSEVRPSAVYSRSLQLLERVKLVAPDIVTKSGIMLGLGETREEVLDVFRDLLKKRCDLLTVGQYLAPSKLHYPVAEYITPEVFDEYKEIGEKAGFLHVASAPLVRSSYMADKAFEVLEDVKKSKSV